MPSLPSPLRQRLTYANVMATIAVFVALGGGAYAATQVTGKTVKDSSLTGRDVKNSSLTGADVKNRSLVARDFASGQLPAGPEGPQGPKGDTGAQGAQGVQGERGPSFGDAGFAVSQSISPCGPATVITKSLTVTEPSRIFAHAQGNYSPNGTAANVVSVDVDLKSGATVVADLPNAQHGAPAQVIAHASGVLTTQANRNAGHVVQPGSYDLVFQASTTGASCPPGGLQASMTNNTLSYVLLGP